MMTDKASDTIDALLARFGDKPHPRLTGLVAHLKQFNAIGPIDADAAAVRARRAMEAMLGLACEAFGIPTGTKNLDRLRTDLLGSHNLPPLIDRHCRVIVAFGNLAAHDNDDSGPDVEGSTVTQLEVEMCGRSLCVIAEWFHGSVLPRLTSDTTLIVIDGKHLTERHMRQAVQIDERVYDAYFRADVEACLCWLRHNPDIYTAVIDPRSDTLVGYVNAMPLEDEFFRKLEVELDLDADVPLDVIRTYSLPDFYKLHICSLAVAPEFSRSSAFRLLLDGFMDKIIQLAQHEIYFTEVLAYAATEQGEKLARYAGMKIVRRTSRGWNVYKTTLLPPELRVPSRKSTDVRACYDEKFRQLKALGDI